MLGEEGEQKENTTIVHSELKKRWQSILKDGLNKEALDSLLKKYQIPYNCPELSPPVLNDLIIEVLNEAGLNRDKRIVEKQRKLGLAISEDTIETLSDSCRLPCYIFHSDSITRRSLIVPGLNKDLKSLISNINITEYLFGNDLQEKVKACKATKNSAKDLKIPPPAKPSVPINKQRPVALNSRGPLRPMYNLVRVGLRSELQYNHAQRHNVSSPDATTITSSNGTTNNRDVVRGRQTFILFFLV